MPSSTTTSVSLGPIRDLPGPGAPGSGPDQDQPSFDTLLRPLARNAAAARTKSSSDPADAAQNQALPVLTEDHPSAFEVVSEGDDPSQPQDEQSPTADLLLVESLAGLAIITPPIAAIDAPIAAEEILDAGHEAPSDAVEPAASRAGKQMPEQIPSSSVVPSPSVAGDQPTSAPVLSAKRTPEVPASISEALAAPITLVVDAGQSELTPAATVDASASVKSTPVESRTDQSPDTNQQHPVTATTKATASAVEVATTAKTESNVKTATSAEPSRTVQTMSAVEPANADTPLPPPESPAIGPTGLENPSTDASSQSTTDSRDQTNDDPNPNENPDPSEFAITELAAEIENSPAPAHTAPETTNQTPAPAQAESSPTRTDSSHAVTTPSAATVLSSLPAPRTRLPADVLVQPAAASSRRATLAIDTKSLLTRVARAFAAAQERDGEIRLRLSPPELGSLRLDVRIQDGVMVARLQTETDAARTAIIENLPALRERLSDQGVRIERFDVDLMHRQPGGTPDQPGRQQPEAPAAPLRVAAPARPRTSAATVTRPSPAAASTGGLNVIV